jgi:hypothetical protein
LSAGLAASATVDVIVGFLRGAGLEVTPGDLPFGTFLPGIRIRDGRMSFDAARLRFPGDLLHEAGHLAVLPPEERERFGTDDRDLDMQRIELRAIAWSYAAAVHLGLDPAVVFHEGGYGGKGLGLARTYALGVYPGASALEEVGLTLTGERAERADAPPYPHMLSWLRQ